MMNDERRNGDNVMRRVILAKERLDEIVARWSAKRIVLAPVRRDAVDFEPVTDAEAMALDYRNTRLPAKRLFFRPCEALLRFDFAATAAQQVVEAPANTGPTVLLGLRPCEARSLVLLDHVFLGQDFRDPYYAARREATALVVLGCATFGPTCFCTTVGGGPADRTGADLFLSAAGDAYVVDVVTEHGQGMLAGFDLLPADPAILVATDRAAELRDIGPDPLAAFDDPAWELLGERCLGCAACSFLCPTCHCFDIQDEVLDKKGRRARNWDCCMFATFTLHASGHNPRPDRLQRVRQRMMHKFVYFPGNFSAVGCVGCGRCIRACPAGNDIRQWLRLLAQACARRTAGAEGAS